jgi:hypothetical protein
MRYDLGVRSVPVQHAIRQSAMLPARDQRRLLRTIDAYLKGAERK